MNKRSVVFTHSYSRMSKKSIIRMESDDHSLKTSLNKNSEMNTINEVTNEDKFFKLFINSLRKTIRNFNDNQIIVKYILGMNDFSNMLKFYLNNYSDLIHIISQTMKYEFYPEKHILFKTGEKGEQFYVILEGAVDILVAKDIKMIMTEEEYVNYMEKLDFYEEYQLINNCVKANRNVFPFEVKQSAGPKSFRKQFLQKKSIVFTDFTAILKELDKNAIQTTDYNSYIDRIKPIHNSEKVTNNSKLIEVKVWQYYHVLKMKTGGYFGDAALISFDQKRYKVTKYRTATIITSQDCHLGVIGKFTFNTCIKEANEKLKSINLNIILNNQIFSEFSKKYFKRFYFNLFVTANFSLYDKVITKGCPNSDIFIVKSGDFEISMKRSLIEIGECIKQLGGKLSNSLEVQEMMNDSPAFRKFMNEKMKYRISIVRESEIVGMSDMVVEGKNYFNVECISSKGEMLKIEKKLLQLIIDEEKYLNSIIQGFEQKKKNYLIERLLKIRETRLNHFTQNENVQSVQSDKIISDLINPITKKQLIILNKKCSNINTNSSNTYKDTMIPTTHKDNLIKTQITKDNQDCNNFTNFSSISRRITNETETINSTIKELNHVQNKFNILRIKVMNLCSKKEAKLDMVSDKNSKLHTPDININQTDLGEMTENTLECDEKKFNLKNLTLDKHNMYQDEQTPTLSPFESKDTSTISPIKKGLFEVLPNLNPLNSTKLSPLNLKDSKSSKENILKPKISNKLEIKDSNYHLLSIQSSKQNSPESRNNNKLGLYKEFIKISDFVQKNKKSFKKQLFNKIVNEYCTPKNEIRTSTNSMEKNSENKPCYVDCLSFDNLKRIYTSTFAVENQKALTTKNSKEKKKKNKYKPFISNFTLKKMVQKNLINDSITTSNKSLLQSIKITGIANKD